MTKNKKWEDWINNHLQVDKPEDDVEDVVVQRLASLDGFTKMIIESNTINKHYSIQRETWAAWFKSLPPERLWELYCIQELLIQLFKKDFGQMSEEDLRVIVLYTLVYANAFNSLGVDDANK